MHRPTVAAFAAASLAAVVAIGVTAPAFAGNDDSARSTTSPSASHSEVESHDASEHATPEVEAHDASESATPTASASAIASVSETVHHHKHKGSNKGRAHAEDAAHDQAEAGDDHGREAVEPGDDTAARL